MIVLVLQNICRSPDAMWVYVVNLRYKNLLVTNWLI